MWNVVLLGRIQSAGLARYGLEWNGEFTGLDRLVPDNEEGERHAKWHFRRELTRIWRKAVITTQANYFDLQATFEVTLSASQLATLYRVQFQQDMSRLIACKGGNIND
jgi:hypothetical protein